MAEPFIRVTPAIRLQSLRPWIVPYDYQLRKGFDPAAGLVWAAVAGSKGRDRILVDLYNSGGHLNIMDGRNFLGHKGGKRMSPGGLRDWRLSGRDVDFLIETVSPEARDRSTLKRIIEEDEDFRKSYLGDEKVFRWVMDDEEILLKISPALYFEILLRRTASDLEAAGYTLEKNRTMKIPVFDTREVTGLLAREPILLYLADMLSSFTRVESYTISVLVGKGVWKRIRFNDLDLHSLTSICEVVDKEYRLGLYKRIADICLFILGIFPDYAERDFRYPFSGQLRPHLRSRFRISPEDYEKDGRKFYQLAAELPSAQELELSEIFGVLNNNFSRAKKPLNYLSDHYLQYTRQKLFI